MNNPNSLVFNYYDEESFNAKTSFRNKILVKHSSSKPARVQYSKKPKEPEMLERKVESLEKKQVLWKERCVVWDKEKRKMEKALKNAYGDPNEYYKNLMLNWQVSKSKLKPGNDFFGNSLDQVRNFISWVLEQPGDTPLKYIKELAKDQFAHLDDIESSYFTETQKISSETSKIIQDLKQENEKITEKITLGVQDVISSLQIKIHETTKALDMCKDEIIEKDKHLVELTNEMSIKSQEIQEYKANIQYLEEQVQDLQQELDEKKLIKLLPMQEIAENTEHAFKKLLLQVKDLETENSRVTKVNEIYEFEIENLKKAQISLEKSRNKKSRDFFDSKPAWTQTLELSSDIDSYYVDIMACLASAVEELIESPIN